MALNWINVEEFSFNSLLMLEKFQIRMLMGCFKNNSRMVGIALKYNPEVAWYLGHRCPECNEIINKIVEDAPNVMEKEEIRKCEIAIMRSIEDFIIYAYPELMDTHCNFIYGWNKERLFELTDFTNKIVLDVGAGNGRLAFAAAERAKEVYACEPVSSLREYMRDKIARDGISNVRVVDGTSFALPYPDDTFDIVMSGHVVGDDYERELAELTRVVKQGGWILDCPGEEDRNKVLEKELVDRGWEWLYYKSKFGGDVYRYRKQVLKK